MLTRVAPRFLSTGYSICAVFASRETVATPVAVRCRPSRRPTKQLVRVLRGHVYHCTPNGEPGAGAAARSVGGLDREAFDHCTGEMSYSDGNRDIMPDALGHLIDRALDSGASRGSRTGTV